MSHIEKHKKAFRRAKRILKATSKRSITLMFAVWIIVMLLSIILYDRTLIYKYRENERKDKLALKNRGDTLLNFQMKYGFKYPLDNPSNGRVQRRIHDYTLGWDIVSPRNKKLISVGNGIVYGHNFSDRVFGYNITIYYPTKNIYVRYCHCSIIRANIGEYVTTETHIADIGSTGRVLVKNYDTGRWERPKKGDKRGNHLHIDAYRLVDGKRVWTEIFE